MNQSNHLISGIVARQATHQDMPDGFDSKYGELIKWAGIFYKTNQQPFCILEPDSLDLIYLNPALRAICKIQDDRTGTSIKDLFDDESIREIKKRSGPIREDSVVLRNIILSWDNRRVFEVTISRHEIEIVFLIVEFEMLNGENPVDIFDNTNPRNQPDKSEELNQVVSSLDDVVFEYDAEGSFKNLWCNNEKLLQRLPKDYVGKSMHEAYHTNPELTGEFIRDFENALTNNEICYRDFQLDCQDEIRWFSSKITPIYHPGGSPKGFSQRITDISEQKKVDLAIHERNFELKYAHRELKEIIENTSEIIFKLDGSDRIIFVSPEFERTLGIPGSEVVGEPISSIIHPGDRERFILELEETRINGTSPDNNIYRAAVGNENSRWFDINAKFLRKSETEAFTGIVFAKDITELKQTLDSLGASEERYRSVVNSLSEGVVMHNREGHVVACNYAAEQMFQLERGAGLSENLRQQGLRVIKADGSPFSVDEFPSVITMTTGRRVKDTTMGVFRPGGELIWITVNTEPVYYSNDAETPDAVVASMIDITEHKIARETLAENTRQIKEYSERITGILDSITDGFIAVDNNLTVTLWNRVIETITGISQAYAVGKNILELNTYMTDQFSIEQYQHAIRNKSAVSFEQYVPAVNHWFESSASPFNEGLFIYFRDITYRKQNENLLALEKRVLENNASRVASLKETIDHFLEGLEEIFPGMLCSVLTLDEDGQTMRHMSAPRLPKGLIDKVDGVQIGPAAGSCGTAMFTKNTVIVS
ncbi:MAG: PAS domain S-box protein, partial [Chitinophagaceae bacterium]